MKGHHLAGVLAAAMLADVDRPGRKRTIRHRFYSPREWRRVKARRKLARESRRRNRP